MEGNFNNDELAKNAKMLVNGLSGMINLADKMVSDALKNAPESEAIKYAKAMQDANINDKLKEVKKEFEKVSKAFNNY